MGEITIETQQRRLQDFEKGFVAMYLMNTGMQLGLLEAVNNLNGDITSKELANRLGLHEPYVRTWCYTAYHFGILDSEAGDRFKLAPHMGTLLTDTHSPFYFGHWIRFMTSYLPDELGRMHEYFKSGQRAPWYQIDDIRGQQLSRDMKALSNQVVPLVLTYVCVPAIPGLKDKLSSGVRVLDVGCGSGALLVRLAHAFPNSQFTGVEIDRFAVAQAQKEIKENVLEDRVSVTLANSTSMHYKSEFDLIVMAVVLHEILPEDRSATIAKCHEALKDSGSMVIFDFAYPETLQDFRNDRYSLGILDQFFETTMGSEHLSASARSALLREHGFRKLATFPIGDGSMEATHASK